jgi:acyl-CoA thioester hydrolase
MELDFISPAHHDDLLSIVTTPERSSGSSFTLRQQVFQQDDCRLLVNALVKLACIGPNLKARRIPDEVRQIVNVDTDTMAISG